jgi:hypothetical protein
MNTNRQTDILTHFLPISITSKITQFFTDPTLDMSIKLIFLFLIPLLPRVRKEDGHLDPGLKKAQKGDGVKFAFQ